MLSTINKGLTVAQRSKQDSPVIVKPGFNPLTFDVANLLALYDGDLDLSNVLWADQSANGYDLTLVNNPTVVAAAINGHDALQFDGINQYGSSVLFAVIGNPITCYIVFKSITNTNSNRIFGTTATFNQLYQNNPPNGQVGLFAGGGINSNPDMVLNTFDIITFVLNDPNSELRTNNNVAVTGAVGVVNSDRIYLATESGVGNFGNIEAAYIIVRTAADSTATQNLFINWLKNRFAL